MNRPQLFPEADGAANACAGFILARLKDAINSRGRASLAVSGGSTPRLMFRFMAAAEFPWDQVDLYFADERCLSPEDADSNYRLALDNLLTPVHYPADRVHRVLGELDPAEAARLYVTEIRQGFGLRDRELPVFDVIQLGMGPDGHTASLFPGSPLLDDREHIADSVINSPKPPKERVTLLPGLLLAARAIVYLVAGDDKFQALQAVLTGPDEPKRWPSQVIARSGKEIDWFVAGLPEIQWP